MKKGRPLKSKTKRNPLRVYIHSKLYELGIGQSEFLKELGMSPVTYYKKMRTENWRVPELYTISRILNVSRADILNKLQEG